MLDELIKKYDLNEKEIAEVDRCSLNAVLSRDNSDRGLLWEEELSYEERYFFEEEMITRILGKKYKNDLSNIGRVK